MDKVVVYRWREVEAHLRTELASINVKLAKADPPELYRLQGRAQALNELLVLPDTLTVLKEGNG